MNAVFLDFETMGPDLDLSPIHEVVSELTIFERTGPEQIVERIADAECVYTNKVRLTSHVLERSAALRFVGLAATGTDNVDLDAAKRLDIAVSNSRAYCTQSVVEHVFGVLLAMTHSLSQYRETVRSGQWQRANSFCPLGHPVRELSAMTLGIVGYGELGRNVARVAETFGMRVLIARRPGSTDIDGDRVSFEKLLETSDVISLHCPLNDATRGLFGSDAFGRMKNDALLINTARGSLVDSAALATALRDGEIAAAAVDVLPQEPPVDGDPLLDYPDDNLILTPHIAWATNEARQNAINQLAASTQAFSKGERLNRVV